VGAGGLRQEFIQLSDVLGVSMLVDAVNHREREGATETTVLGPFYVGEHRPTPQGADISQGITGEPMFVRSRVTDLAGRPLAAPRSTSGTPMMTVSTIRKSLHMRHRAPRCGRGSLPTRRAILVPHDFALQLSNPDRWPGRRIDHRNQTSPDAAGPCPFPGEGAGL
jgi:hypothetical protein